MRMPFRSASLAESIYEGLKDQNFTIIAVAFDTGRREAEPVVRAPALGDLLQVFTIQGGGAF